jgi:hypothetical protein
VAGGGPRAYRGVVRNILRRGSRREPVYRVTAARRGTTEDVRRRERRYVITMLVRTACLLLAIFVPVTPLRIAFVIGAVFLPYFAVVFANGGREPATAAPDLLDAPPRTRLETGLAPGDATGTAPGDAARTGPGGQAGTDSPPPEGPPRHGSVS